MDFFLKKWLNERSPLSLSFHLINELGFYFLLNSYVIYIEVSITNTFMSKNEKCLRWSFIQRPARISMCCNDVFCCISVMLDWFRATAS